MLSIFIMLFVAIGIAAGLGFAIVTLINTAQTSLNIQANQVRLQNVANSVRAGLAVDGTRVLLPVKTDDGRYLARLPDSSPFSKTTTGGDIVYCPAFAAPGDGADFVNPLVQGGDEVFQVTRTDLGGKEYLSGGHPDYSEGLRTRLSEMGVVAYLMSPQPNNKNTLACGDVELGDDNYTLVVRGGSVVPIYTVTTDARGSVFTVYDGDSAPPGYNGSDRVVRKIGDVANFIRQFSLTDVTVRVPSSLKSIQVSDLARLTDASASRVLRLVPGDANDGTALSHAALNVVADGTPTFGNVFIPVKGKFHLEGVDLVGDGFDLVLEASSTSDVVLKDTTVAGLKSVGGRISTTGNTVVRPDHGEDTRNNPVYALGGQISMSTGTEIQAPDAVMVMRANAGTIMVSSDVTVETSATAVLAAQQNGGRVVVPLKSLVDDSGQILVPSLPVTRSGISGTEAVSSTKDAVSVACQAGQTSCEAICTGGKIVVSGGCSSASGTPLVSFGPVFRTTPGGTPLPTVSYSCTFASAPTVTSPVASAVCDYN